ncbi:PREDICTED: E3 ubiquitin-protein ligase SGR9, amyloplastic-like [Tarenaya hassleriana]|uniref:E3 ubiquitin-protein ligase SGR9, amyloplastic-like n=1 Tax=Tarenaya hassleriana TaxID=28532 RepID=UPI00053C844E|nr:PREDICTED: E3 ubiquitin-protein ligase SGR9, amyloplastic-like [Tarenaya hassleriana]
MKETVRFRSEVDVIFRQSSTGSIGFIIKLRQLQRSIRRRFSGHETLTNQSSASTPWNFRSQIPTEFLHSQETCRRYIERVLSEKNLNRWIQERLATHISEFAAVISRHLVGGDYVIVADAEIVNESLIDEAEERKKMDCSICLEGLLSDQKVCMDIPCSHVFHRDCILEWLQDHESCPLCRRSVNNP